MRSAEEIIIKLINTNKINGEDAIVLIKAICTNNANGSITTNTPDYMKPPFNPNSSSITTLYDSNNYKLSVTG